MPRTRLTVTLLLALGALPPAGAGPGPLFSRKPKVDEAGAAALVQTLRNDPDEKKRKAAADALGGADAISSPDVAPALIHALRKDASPAVRAVAADSLRQLGEVYPSAGVALEAAFESDPSPLVKLAAKRALWEYHLHGYRTAKGTDGSPGQTVEPPLASRAGARPAVAFAPAPPPPGAGPRVPPAGATAIPVAALPAVSAQPTGSQPAAGRMFWPNVIPGPRTAIRSALNLGPPPFPNFTGEPPLARAPHSPRVTVEAARNTPEPPLRLPPAQERPVLPTPIDSLAPAYTPALPPFVPELPPIVTPPGK